MEAARVPDDAIVNQHHRNSPGTVILTMTARPPRAI
jgi:hypothetical protein